MTTDEFSHKCDNAELISYEYTAYIYNPLIPSILKTRRFISSLIGLQNRNKISKPVIL